MKPLILPRIQFVACHRLPERSFFFRGRQFPVCARCTGVLLGYLSMPLFTFNIIQIVWWLALVCNLPAYIDGASQAVGLRESTNSLRFFTGLLSGFGQMALISIIGQGIGFWLAGLIKGGV